VYGWSGGGGVKYAQKHARARITSAAIICAQSARESVRMRLELVIHAPSGGHNDASALSLSRTFRRPQMKIIIFAWQ